MPVPQPDENSSLPGRRAAVAVAVVAVAACAVGLPVLAATDGAPAPAAPPTAERAALEPVGPTEGVPAAELRIPPPVGEPRSRRGERSETPELRSRSIGEPFAGALDGGVPMRPQGATFFTWDPVLRRQPNRQERRYGTDLLVLYVERVLAGYKADHPRAPRVGIGDLSRPRGGPFASDFGGLGHGSHQNGRDIDLYYPRLDRAERPPDAVEQIDRRLSQDLVDRFVAAGAQLVFIGPRTGLRGPPGRVQELVLHDDHMHVRIGPTP